MPSSPRLRWTDLRHHRTGVWGVGVEGRATLARLAELGVPVRTVVDDAISETGLLGADEGGLEALAECDVVIKSPGIERYGSGVRYLEASDVAVVGGLGLWLEEHGAEGVIGVTGTKGKSTTTSLVQHLASGFGIRCSAGGNIGTVPWSPEASSDTELWVIEVSSYQATDLWSSPAVVAITSLHPDHLNWHGTVERYYRDKLSLCGRPGARVTIANGTDDRLRGCSEALRPGPRWVDRETVVDTSWTERLHMRGVHNETNALIAAACLEEMGVDGADDPTQLAVAARGYRNLPHRLETIATIGGVEYVDDALSTNVLPTIVAAQVFDGRALALLVGGFDRAIDYGPLAAYVAAREAPTLVLTLPQNGPSILRAVEEHGGEATGCRDISDAVGRAAAWSPAGGVVLLSPAAASYGMYRNYLARAEAFRTAVAELRRGA